MAFTDPMFQFGMRLTMENSKYEEYSDLVNRVMQMMKDEECVDYALGYMVQTYINLADRIDRLDTEIKHMQLIEKELQRTLEKSA